MAIPLAMGIRPLPGFVSESRYKAIIALPAKWLACQVKVKTLPAETLSGMAGAVIVMAGTAPVPTSETWARGESGSLEARLRVAAHTPLVAGSKARMTVQLSVWAGKIVRLAGLLLVMSTDGLVEETMLTMLNAGLPVMERPF